MPNLTDIQQLLLKHEGKRATAYDDATGLELHPGMLLKGNVTIGVGRNLTGKGLRDDEISFLLSGDIADAIRDARAVLPCYDELSRPRQLALISMAFNLGRAGLEQFKRFISAVEIGDYEDAADEMLASRWAVQVSHRADELAWMMRHDPPSTQL
jgi:lysozyme